MRAVKGEVISSTPISLSKAAAVLARFAASETGARPEVAAYLKRSVADFNDLVAAHRRIRIEEKEGAIKDEENGCLIKKKKERRSFYEGETDGGGEKVEALGSEKKSEERRCKKEKKRSLVLESLNFERKERKDLDAQEGEVNGEIKKNEGKMKKRRRIVG